MLRGQQRVLITTEKETRKKTAVEVKVVEKETTMEKGKKVVVVVVEEEGEGHGCHQRTAAFKEPTGSFDLVYATFVVVVVLFHGLQHQQITF